MSLVDSPGIITHLDIQAALLVRFRVGIVAGDIVTIPYGHIILGRRLGVRDGAVLEDIVLSLEYQLFGRRRQYADTVLLDVLG